MCGAAASRGGEGGGVVKSIGAPDQRSVTGRVVADAALQVAVAGPRRICQRGHTL